LDSAATAPAREKEVLRNECVKVAFASADANEQRRQG
jgi:hypothetical protein